MRPSAHATPADGPAGRRVLLGLAGRALTELRGSAPEGALLETVSHPHLRALELKPGDRLYVAAFAEDRELLLIGRLDVGPGSTGDHAQSGPAATPVAFERRVPHEHARALADGRGRGLRFARARDYELHPAALIRPIELNAGSASRLDELLPEPQPLAGPWSAPAPPPVLPPAGAPAPRPRVVSAPRGPFPASVGPPAPPSPPPPAAPKAPSARAQAMAQLRAQGQTLEQIGRRFSVTRVRVRQVLKSHGGLGARGASQVRKQNEVNAAQRRASDILDAYRDGRDLDALAGELGLARAAVHELAADQATRADRAARTKIHIDASSRRAKTYSDAALIAAVATVAEELGRTPTAAQYAQRAALAGLPSVPTIQNRLGWSAAVRAAGLAPAAPGRAHYRRQWTEDACWEAIRRVAAELGRVPTVQGYEAHATGRADLPSSATIRNRLGPWSAIGARLAADADAVPRPFQTPGATGDPAPVPSNASGAEPKQIRTSDRLTPGDVWTREQLSERFAISDATLNTGIFQPAGHRSIWLFVTRDKQPDREQYRDDLAGDVLTWDGQMEGRKDHLVIEHLERGLEILLFYRTSKREHPGAGFVYHGPFLYESHSGHRPASFVLRRDG